MANTLKTIYNSVISNNTLSRTETEYLINTSDNELKELMAYAKKIREKFVGDQASLCSIINARSGKCSENCCYCAQSAQHKTDSPVYGFMDKAKIIEAAQRSVENGARCFSIVTSGKGATKDFSTVVSIVKELSAQNINISASLGLLTLDQAKVLKAAGLYKYHHNLETARSFFPQMCTTHTYEDRIKTVLNAKEAGLNVCCGGIFGLGESPEQRVELGLAIRDLDVDSIPINILHQIPGTRIYGQIPPMLVNDILRLIAVFRFILPNKDIGVMGGRQINLKERQSEIFEAGANGILIGNYLTTTGSEILNDITMVENAGFQAKTVVVH